MSQDSCFIYLPSFIAVYVGRVSVIKLLIKLLLIGEAEVLLHDFKMQFIFLVL